MAKVRDFKDVLKAQLSFVNYVVKDIKFHIYSADNLQDLINHVNKFASCSMNENRIKVCVGPVCGYVSIDQLDYGHVRFKMSSVGFKTTTYKGLVRELNNVSERYLEGTDVYKEFEENLCGEAGYALDYTRFDNAVKVQYATVK